MKLKYLYKYIPLLFLAIGFVSCEDKLDVENKEVDKPIEKSEDYLRALRAYKKTDHEVAFGWFGGWNPDQSTRANTLVAAPDSMDIISIWGPYWDLSDAQKADLKDVQENYGTKVTYTIFAHEVPEPFQPTPEGVADYAKALADTMYKYNYDGIDLDYEPGFGGHGPLVGTDNKLMTAFVEALGNYFGPKSGSDKLLLIDGVPYAIESHLPEYFNYGIVQAYSSWGDSDLQGRFNSALAKGWKPEQYIFAENFEDHWATGGTSYSHTQEDGTVIRIPSLEGMARFQPTVNGERQRKGGAGSYHMEYEYKHSPEYKFMRGAIQVMNPSQKSN